MNVKVTYKEIYLLSIVNISVICVFRGRYAFDSKAFLYYKIILMNISFQINDDGKA